MKTDPVNLFIVGLLFLLIFVLGYRLSRSGRPYHPVLFNLHKLIALGCAVFVIVLVIRAQPALPFSLPQVAIIAAAGLCFIALLVSGGLISAMHTPPGIARLLHRVLPYFALLATAAGLYTLLGS